MKVCVVKDKASPDAAKTLGSLKVSSGGSPKVMPATTSTTPSGSSGARISKEVDASNSQVVMNRTIQCGRLMDGKMGSYVGGVEVNESLFLQLQD